MNSPKSVGINQLSFDLKSLELIARANYLLTIQDRKQRQLQQVVALMLDSPLDLSRERIDYVEALRPLAGEAILFVRLDKRQQMRAEFLKNTVLQSFGYHWQIRDVVVYLCKGLIEKLS